MSNFESILKDYTVNYFNLFWFKPHQLDSFEWYFDFRPWNTALFRYPWVHLYPWVAISLYIFLLWLIPKVLKSPVKWVDKVLPVWNCFLWLFSVAMLYGAIDGIIYYWVRVWSIHGLICSDVLLNDGHPVIFWTYLFLISKFLELGDTLFIVLKHPDKPVELLHWWHHISVLLFSWYASSYRMQAGLFFFFFNALVHSFMYYYYFQMSIGNRPTWARWLTRGQILQMIVGTVLNIYWTVLYFMDVPCSGDEKHIMIAACGVMYGSYLYLFLDFYIKKYLAKGDVKKVADPKKNQ